MSKATNEAEPHRPLRQTMQIQLGRYLARAVDEHDDHAARACRLALYQLEEVELLERQRVIEQKLAALRERNGGA